MKVGNGRPTHSREPQALPTIRNLPCHPEDTAAAAKLLQSCPTLCGPRDGSPPGSLIPGILQARTLEWVAISFSNVWKWKVKVKSLSRVRLFETPWTAACQAPPSMGFSRQEDWSGVPVPSPPEDTAAAAAKSLQSCPTLCDPIDGSPPGSPVPGILQARTLEWVAISFSNVWKWKWSRSVVSDSSRPHGPQPTRLLRPWDFPGKSTGVGCHCPLRLKTLGNFKSRFI